MSVKNEKVIHNKSYCRNIAYLFSFLVLLLILPGKDISAHDDSTLLVETIKKVKPSIIAVGTYHPLSKPAVRFYGTGFVFSKNGYAITAEHVISAINRKGGADNVYAFFPAVGNSKKFRARVISENVKYDLAIIKLKGSGFN